MIVHVVGAAILHQGRILIARRAPGKVDAGLWEFPGGKVESGETPRHALCREIQEELGITVSPGAWVAQGHARLASGLDIVLDVYLCQGELPARELTSSDHDQLKWVAPEELEAYRWPQADLPAVRALSQRGR